MEQPGATLAEAVPPGIAPLPPPRPRPFPPADFPAWAKTCDDLRAAIGSGPGIVALVGADGSGKTLTLMTRLPPSTPSVELVDDVDRSILARLAAGQPATGVRVLAVTPDLLAALVDAFPDARIVRMRPMSSVDVHAMLDARQSQAGRPPGALSPRAIRRLEELCDGNPRRLDRLLGRAGLVARAAKAGQIAAEHVDAAARRTGPGPQACRPGMRPIRPKAVRPAAAPRRPGRGLVWPGGAVAGRWAALLGGTIVAVSVGAGALWPVNDARRAMVVAAVVPPEIPQGPAPVPPVAPSVSVAGEAALAALAAASQEAEPAAIGSEVAGPAAGPAEPLAETDRPPIDAAPPPSSPTVFVRVTRPIVVEGRSEPAAQPAAPIPDTAMEPFVTAYELPPAPESVVAANQSAGRGQPGVVPEQAATAPDATAPAMAAQTSAGSTEPPDAPATAASTAAPAPVTMAAVAPVAKPRDPEKAARLFAIGRTMISIGQVADARVMLKASAELGNQDAARLAATLDLRSVPGPSQPRAR